MALKTIKYWDNFFSLSYVHHMYLEFKFLDFRCFNSVRLIDEPFLPIFCWAYKNQLKLKPFEFFDISQRFWNITHLP